MHAVAVRYDLRLAAGRSLKSKRAVLRPLVDGLRHRLHVSVAEVGHHDSWQRAEIGVALVAPTAARLQDALDTVDRFVRSRPDIEVLDVETGWLDSDGVLVADGAEDGR